MTSIQRLGKLIFICYLLLFISSIFSCRTSNLIKYKNNEELKKAIFVFEQTEKATLYKTEINLFKNYFSGITVIKKISKKTYRIVFMNETGMKFFDFEISPEDYKIHHIFKPMNKKIFVKLLINDYRLILMNNINTEQAKKYLTKNKQTFVIKPNKSSTFYFFDTKTGLPERVEKYSYFRKIITINYLEYKNNKPQKIKINHKNILFKMEFLVVSG